MSSAKWQPYCSGYSVLFCMSAFCCRQGQRPLDSWEVPRSSLTFLEVLGQGAFGQVVRGKLIISGSQASAKHYTQMYESSPGPLEIIVAVKLLIGKYSRVPLWRGHICHDITFNTAMTMTERKSNTGLTKCAPYLALTGELWGVFCEDFGENRLRYNGTVLYVTTTWWGHDTETLVPISTLLCVENLLNKGQ